ILLGTGGGAFYLLRDNNQSPVPPISVGNQPLAMAAVDVDLDGHLDLVVANGDGTVRILRGTGDGSFSLLSNDSGGSPVTVIFPVGPSPSSVRSGDFNGDGRPDLAVISTDGTLSMIMGVTNSAALFQPLQTCPILGASPCKVGNVPAAMTTGEFNGDARTDLAIVNSGNNTLTLLLGNGDGTFTPMPTVPLSGTVGSNPSLLIGDLNRDGLFDLTVTGGTTISPLLGEEKPLSGISVQATDINGVPQGNGNVFYFNDTGAGVDYGLTATSTSGRFIIFNVTPGLTQVRASTGGAGNRITTVYPDAYTNVSLKVVNIQPFTIAVSGYVLDPVGPPPQGVGVANVHVHLLGTTCETNSGTGSVSTSPGIYNFSNIFTNSEYIAELLFTPPSRLPPPPSPC
ncbi:MAG TPA: VCBS repeat-containing protein, partial [Nitrospiria bacterium]|nr:VCBS repeat-containing protein [Nitrospiria bacterium]